MNFRDALISTYCENPCQVLPNALWKTVAQLDSLETSFRVENNQVTQLAAWREKDLLVYWTRSREHPQDILYPPNGIDLALIHQDDLHRFPSQSFTTRTPYFRLIHSLIHSLIHRQTQAEVKRPIPPGFRIVEVSNIQQEAAQIAGLIGQCYPDIHPDVETVIHWSSHPTFDPSLWIWVVDLDKGLPVGLGIAEIDPTILEGSLEWIQVLPAYQGLCLGRMIVQELLSRLEGRVKFTTVAGEIENQTKPEALYRSCGFEGRDVWWMLRK